MTDEIIQELWRIKDGIAQDHGYDLDMLVAYLRGKERAGVHHVTDPRSIKETAEQGVPVQVPTSRR